MEKQPTANELKEMTCSKKVWQDWHSHDCQKPVRIVRDGKPYCKIHDPEYVAEKEAQRDAKYKANCCKGCGHHFMYPWHRYCPLCGTQRYGKRTIKSKN